MSKINARIQSAAIELHAAKQLAVENQTEARNDEQIKNSLRDCLNLLADLQTLTNTTSVYQNGLDGPHYKHDDALVIIRQKQDCKYQRDKQVSVLLNITNTGLLTWRNRYIRFVKRRILHINESEVGEGTLLANVNTSRKIIPELKHGESTQLELVVDTGLVRGNYDLICEIRDENDQNCFPNRPDLIRIPVKICDM